MNITAKNGKRSITLTKTERNQMAAAQETCGELYKQLNGSVREAADQANAALGILLAEFRADAAESETEADNSDGRAEATTAKV